MPPTEGADYGLAPIVLCEPPWLGHGGGEGAVALHLWVSGVGRVGGTCRPCCGPIVALMPGSARRFCCTLLRSVKTLVAPPHRPPLPNPLLHGSLQAGQWGIRWNWGSPAGGHAHAHCLRTFCHPPPPPSQAGTRPPACQQHRAGTCLTGGCAGLRSCVAPKAITKRVSWREKPQTVKLAGHMAWQRV